MKRIAFILLICTLGHVVQAQRSTCIIIKQKSGNETLLELASKPVITFEGENMVIVNSFTSITIPIEDIDNYVISKDATEVSELVLQPQYTRNHVIFTGIAKGARINVYTIDGKDVVKNESDDSGIVDINLDSLPKGMYIIKVSNKSIKVFNK